DAEASVTIAGDVVADLHELLEAGPEGGDVAEEAGKGWLSGWLGHKQPASRPRLHAKDLTRDESLAQIDRALAAQRLTLSEQTIGDVTDELRAQVQQE